MAKVGRFEDLEVWKAARKLCKAIYAVSNQGAFSRDFGLRDQIRRAAVSIMSNIAEGFERGGDKEFFNFLSIAKGSSGEVRSQLFIALDQNYLSEKEFEELNLNVNEISRMLSGFMRYLQQSEYRGNKYQGTQSKPQDQN